jgi:hypothetical protein
MGLLTYPVGLQEVSMVQSIGEYIIKKVPERWLYKHDKSESKESENGQREDNSVLFRWR